MSKRFAKSVFTQLELALDRFSAHRLTDWAAALTYYSVLSIFPGILVIVSLLAVIGHGTQDALLESLSELPQGPSRDIMFSAIKHIQDASGAATTALISGALIAIYSASSYVGAFIRAAGVILGVKETRRFYVTIPLRYALTFLLMVLVVVTAIAIVLTGPIADEVARLAGLDPGTIAWSAIRWPLVLVLFYVGLGVLYSLGPDFDQEHRKFATPGTLLALALWLIASGLFSFYVNNFGSFNRVFGSLAGLAVFLIWLYISNLAVLLGLEFDYELRRFRQANGHGAFSRERFRRDSSEVASADAPAEQQDQEAAEPTS